MKLQKLKVLDESFVHFSKLLPFTLKFPNSLTSALVAAVKSFLKNQSCIKYNVLTFLQKMVERFERDYSTPANENVRERIFSVSDDRILLKYHLEDQRVTSSTREFIKPANYSSEKGTPLQLTPDTTIAFQVSSFLAMV